MSTLFRSTYDDGDLDDTTGPVPEWGNPASIGTGPPGHTDMRCNPCGVQWHSRDSYVCWMCGVDPWEGRPC